MDINCVEGTLSNGKCKRTDLCGSVFNRGMKLEILIEREGIIEIEIRIRRFKEQSTLCDKQNKEENNRKWRFVFT